jgi:hypothetical protein
LRLSVVSQIGGVAVCLNPESDDDVTVVAPLADATNR